MRVNIISFVALATTATALLVTYPRIGEKIDPDMPLTIKWQAVATDPDTFSIELVNQNVYPPTTEVVVEDIDSSKGSYTVKAKTFTGVDDGKGYQINFISPTSGILAQSQQFRVTEPGAIASSSGKETSTALETSSASLMSSTASTSDITSIPLSTASSYLSSTAHSSTRSTSASIMASTSTSMSTATHSNTTTSTTTRRTSSTTISTATESATTTTNAAAVLMPPAGSLLLGLLALVL
ncbi:Cell wall beta-glucan synthesis [Penicillium robsamsonii]|uniref:Cell wall beta-glucan synthesis n=1 Tax=Penicillium robsamsonii TaxID=1792511 RepID=UPI00254817E0|nr:Cell wall beta-glucan synthesis [Penicillium robsamsonii]KAJ5835719.1 Cell wall beta-glucan synthesis [Penicillium robsamsonii]